MSAEDQPTEEIIVPNQYEITMAYLEHERDEWLPHYKLSRETTGAVQADALARADFFMGRIDKLLQELVEIDGK